MRIIDLNEFEDLRKRGASNILGCYDEDRKCTVFAVVDENELDKSPKDLFELLSVQLYVTPEHSVLRKYWIKNE